MAGINQIPKLSYWASSTDINKMITSLNQVLLTLQTNIDDVATTPAKALVVSTFALLPMDLEDGSLAVTRDTSNMYYFKSGAWIKIVTI